jgi:hypothetical protein
MTERVYTIDELKTILKEGANEFKAKVGKNVNEFNKKENKNAFSNAEQKAKELGGDVSKVTKQTELDEKTDGNKTTLDYENSENQGENYRDKVKAQAEGYTSVLEKDNGIEKVGEFNDAIYKQLQKAGKEMAKNKVLAKKSGLTARELPDSAFEKESMYKESKKIAVLNFKNTTFLNESHMISRIPDEYKKDGKRFKMKDAEQNEFILEWNEGEANILSYENKKKLNESIEKFQRLTGYNSKNQFKKTSVQSRLNESQEFNRILKKTREITNNN